MQERISEYISTLKVKDTQGYEMPARVCSEYFDSLGINAPTTEDWQAFKEYFMKKYESEKGKKISQATLEQNYVSRGKAFYRWCASQDMPPVHEEAIPAVMHSDTSSSEVNDTLKHQQAPSEKSLRVNFLLSKEHHEALMSLAYLKDKTLTAVVTEAIEAYIQGYSEEIAILKETRRKLREK